VAFEADALAYAVSGYSGILRVSLANGLNIALGAGRYEVPGSSSKGRTTTRSRPIPNATIHRGRR
jgi:hypothetical protein